MPHYPQSATGLNYITYPVGPTVNTTITPDPGTTPNTKGAYVQIVASTPFAANRIRLGLSGVAASSQTWLCDIAFGAPGSEVVVLPDLTSDAFTSTSSINNAAWHDFPLLVPAGTRISVRCQCNAASRTLGIYLVLMATGDTPGISSFTTYGALTASSKGTNIDPGAVANTKGAYTQITASTTGVIQWLSFHVGHSASDASAYGWAFDIATGAAGSEVVLIPDLRVQCPTGSGALVPRSYAFLTYIPAGTRIAVRASCTLSSAGTRTMDVILIAATAPVEPSTGGASAYAFA